MAATWTDAPEDHREGRRSPARGPVARRCARKSDAALHPMHCVSGAAIPVRLALLGARYGLCEPLVSPFAPRKNETFAKKWGQAPRVGVILPVCTHGRRSQSPFFRKNETFAERKATNFAKAISDDPFESAGVVGDATALLGTKIKAGDFLVKVQEIRLKQQKAARKSERSALSFLRREGKGRPLRKNRGALTKCLSKTNSVGWTLVRQGGLKPTLRLQPRRPLRKNRGALTKAGEGKRARVHRERSYSHERHKTGSLESRPTAAG